MHQTVSNGTQKGSQGKITFHNRHRRKPTKTTFGHLFFGFLLANGIRPGTNSSDMELPYDWPLNWVPVTTDSTVFNPLQGTHPDAVSLLWSLGGHFLKRLIFRCLGFLSPYMPDSMVHVYMHLKLSLLSVMIDDCWDVCQLAWCQHSLLSQVICCLIR